MLDINAISEAGCWVRPSWALANGLFLAEAGSWDNDSMSCRGWPRHDSGYGGLVLTPFGEIGVSAGSGTPSAPEYTCDQTRPVACCKPVSVGEPLSSLTIPIGAGALAGCRF